ncbi:MAG: hypothetical protein AB8B56_20890 [Crocinitomicaceae bacterium]
MDGWGVGFLDCWTVGLFSSTDSLQGIVGLLDGWMVGLSEVSTGGLRFSKSVCLLRCVLFPSLTFGLQKLSLLLRGVGL